MHLKAGDLVGHTAVSLATEQTIARCLGNACITEYNGVMLNGFCFEFFLTLPICYVRQRVGQRAGKYASFNCLDLLHRGRDLAGRHKE